MTIVHVSFAPVTRYDDPLEFLKAIKFFTGILEEQAKTQDVTSVYCLNTDQEAIVNGVKYHFFRSTFFQNYFPEKVSRYVSSLNPNAVIVHGLHFAFQLWFLRLFLSHECKVFMQHHAERPPKFHKHVFSWLADREVDGYFFSSLGLSQPWVKQRLIKTAEKVHEVMEVSSTFRPMRKAEARQFLTLTNRKIYLWVGRLDTNKDPLTAIRAFKIFSSTHPDVKLFMIFQSNDLLKEVNEAISGLSAQIILIGRLNHSELQVWYSGADFIISSSHYESGGLAVCEAMSCGCIPIVTDIPSFRMMTDQGKAGLLFRPGDVDSLANALEKSAILSLDDWRNAVVNRFENKLSFRAISNDMNAIISSVRKDS